MLKGKILYTHVFFNHQMGMAYLSYLIQKILSPHTLYQLIESHRLFNFIFGVAMDVLLIARFGVVGFGFALIYETSNLYFLVIDFWQKR